MKGFIHTHLRNVAAILLLSVTPLQTYAQDENTEPSISKYADLRVRFGMGGFSDSRSPGGDLGGDQFTLDFKPVKLPVTISLSSEHYANSADPTEPYEIDSLYSVNLLYSHQFFGFDRASYFLGGGIGRLKVPTGGQIPGNKVKGDLYNLEAGINVRVWRKLGVYGLVKYLNSEKTVDSIRIIDFDETIVLLGIAYDFWL